MVGAPPRFNLEWWYVKGGKVGRVINLYMWPKELEKIELLVTSPLQVTEERVRSLLVLVVAVTKVLIMIIPMKNKITSTEIIPMKKKIARAVII